MGSCCDDIKTLQQASSSTCQAGPRGEKGDAGAAGSAGSDGVSAFTTLLDSAVMPAVNATVTLQVANSDWIGVGQHLFIEGIGYFVATATPDSTHVTVSNVGYGPNVVAGTNIPYGSLLSPAGPKGANQPDDTKAYILLQRQAASGATSGTFTQGAWRSRLINTNVKDTKSRISALNGATGVFTLKAGRYRFKADVPAYNVLKHRSRLRNITSGGATYGTSEYTGATAQTSSYITGFLDLLVDTDFIIESRCSQTQATRGFGQECGFDTDLEVWESIEFIEV